MNLYDIINPSDALTMYAADIKTAAAAVAILSDGAAGAKDVATGESTPCMFGWPEFLDQHGMNPLDAWVAAHKADVVAALRSVLLSHPAERPVLDAQINALPPGGIRSWITARNDKVRSSLNDYESRAHRIADHIEQHLAVPETAA